MRGQVIAFDFGLSQIGLASGNTQSGVSSPLTTLKAKQGQPDWVQLKKILDEWQPEIILVGLPLNMDGSESQLSQRASKFARQIEGRMGLKAEMVDERLTSREAKQIAAEQGHKGDYKDAPVDALAAQLILEQWLANRP